jgi:hypothetical protein
MEFRVEKIICDEFNNNVLVTCLDTPINPESKFDSGENILFGLNLALPLHQLLRHDSEDDPLLYLCFYKTKVVKINTTDGRFKSKQVVELNSNWCNDNLEFLFCVEIDTTKTNLLLPLLSLKPLFHYESKQESMTNYINRYSHMPLEEQMKIFMDSKSNIELTTCLLLAIIELYDSNFHFYYSNDNVLLYQLVPAVKKNFLILYYAQFTSEKMDEMTTLLNSIISESNWIFFRSMYKDYLKVDTTKWIPIEMTNKSWNCIKHNEDLKFAVKNNQIVVTTDLNTNDSLIVKSNTMLETIEDDIVTTKEDLLKKQHLLANIRKTEIK